MSVFSIIQRSQQQQFSLQTRSSSLPQTGTSSDARSRDTEDKAIEKATELAGNLVEATSTQTEEAQDEADEMVEDYKDAVSLNSSLSRAVKDNSDAERELRIERMAQQIKRLKEELRFATPEKAKRMLRELQQIAKNFKTASVELRKAAEKIGPDRPNAVVDVAADATSHAIQTKVGSSDVTPDDLAGAVGDLAGALFAPRQSSPAQTMSSPASVADAVAGDVSAMDIATSLLSGAVDDFAAGIQDQLGGEKDAAYYQAAVYAYADLQHQSDSLYRKGRIETMRSEHEALMEIFQEIELLAGSLETLVDKDDEQAGEALEEIVRNLAEGYEILDNDDLQQFLGAGRYAPAAGTDMTTSSTSGTSGVTTVMTAISVETTVSISISGIVV